MKILFIITDYGSFNNFIGDLAVRLSNSGCQVHVICSSQKVIKIDDHHDYMLEGIQISYVPFPRGLNPIKLYQSSRKVQKIVAAFHPDVVSIHFTTGIFTSTFLGHLGFPTLGTFHGLGFPVVEGRLKKWLFRLIEQQCLQKIDQAWVLNKSDKQILNKLFPSVDAELLPTKGLGCDLQRFDPSKFSLSHRAKIKEELGLHPEDFVLTFTGRFVFFKGFDKVVRAFNLLINKSLSKVGVKLLLIGGADDAHSSGLSNQEQKELEHNDAIKLIGFSKEVEKYLAITDLFVFPSEKEGMPVCIIESLAMGVPVITTSARGCADLIENNHNGLILEENTPEVLADYIYNLLDNRDRLSRFKKNIQLDRTLYDRANFINHQVDLLSSFNKIKRTKL